MGTTERRGMLSSWGKIIPQLSPQGSARKLISSGKAGLGLFSLGEHHRVPASQGSIPAPAHRSLTPPGPAPATAPGMLHVGMQGKG